jgi:hypothetical protein
MIRYKIKKFNEHANNKPNYKKHIIDDFIVYQGKDAHSNDYVTFELGEPEDYWLHVKSIPGSHVLIKVKGMIPTSEVIKKAAQIAGKNSKAKDDNVVVIYCKKKFVKKERDMKPGEVRIDKHNSYEISVSIKNNRSNKMKFSEDFKRVIHKMAPKTDLLSDINGLNSDKGFYVDISSKKSYININNNGKIKKVKLIKFLNYFFKEKYTSKKLNTFVASYNRALVNNNKFTIIPRSFIFSPKDIRNTFISLVTETYPMGYEEELLPLITPGLTKDKYGNYYIIVGNSPDTAFTCHLDTFYSTKDKINLLGYKKDGDDFITSDGKLPLGADDKAGVCIIMYMIDNNIPGVYWFFMGEERGTIGSKNVANNLSDYKFMNNVRKIISFDRRNYYSVITSQLGVSSCSHEFASSLCDELNKHNSMNLNLDPTGVSTDSANFIGIIPECTNISVGYFNQHTNEEFQNITFLEKLAQACVNVNWGKLPVKETDEIHSVIEKYKGDDV